MFVRARFLRGNQVKYISHLDLMRVFERALRRANLPIAYSKGYNPRPKMVFALPLSVGTTSEGEYVDFKLEETMGLEEFILRLNKSLPNGLKIIKAYEFDGKNNAMASVFSAQYNMFLGFDSDVDVDEILRTVEKLLENTEIIVDKKTKKGLKKVDIKPLIRALRVIPLEYNGFKGQGFGYNLDAGSIEMDEELAIPDGVDLGKCEGVKISILIWVNAGSKSNLKPELFVEALQRHFKEIVLCGIHRKNLFMNE